MARALDIISDVNIGIVWAYSCGLWDLGESTLFLYVSFSQGIYVRLFCSALSLSLYRWWKVLHDVAFWKSQYRLSFFVWSRIWFGSFCFFMPSFYLLAWLDWQWTVRFITGLLHDLCFRVISGLCLGHFWFLFFGKFCSTDCNLERWRQNIRIDVFGEIGLMVLVYWKEAISLRYTICDMLIMSICSCTYYINNIYGALCRSNSSSSWLDDDISRNGLISWPQPSGWYLMNIVIFRTCHFCGESGNIQYGV